MASKYLILAFGFLLLHFPLMAQAQYRIFYIPYETETFVPVGADKIETEALFVLEYGDTTLERLFAKKYAKGTQDVSSNMNLRGKIVRLKDNKSIYLDKVAGLLNNEQVPMAGLGTRELKKLVHHLKAKSIEACTHPQAKFVIKANHCPK